MKQGAAMASNDKTKRVRQHELSRQATIGGSMSDPFDGLPRGHFGAIYADPPWRWESWGKYRGQRSGLAPMGGRSADKHYDTAEATEIQRLPVADLAAPDCVLFMWATWPMLHEALDTIAAWGFEYKTCAFSWMKADARQVDLSA
jgi:hypothetical protein